MYTLLVLYFCSQSVKDLIFAPSFGKRVQRYDLFPNWQNLSATFFQEIAKKTAFGQNNRTNWGKWDNKRAYFTPKSTLLHVTSCISHFTSHSMHRMQLVVPKAVSAAVRMDTTT